MGGHCKDISPLPTLANLISTVQRYRAGLVLNTAKDHLEPMPGTADSSLHISRLYFSPTLLNPEPKKDEMVFS